MERSKMIDVIHSKTQNIYRCRICGRFHAGPICLECVSSSIQDSLAGIVYENFLFSLTGKTSCRALSDQELEKVLESLSLICLEMEKQKRREAWMARRKLMGIIRSQATRMFEANAQIRVDGFCEKCIGKALERCNEKELRKVIGWLRRLEKRGKSEGYTGGSNEKGDVPDNDR